MRAISDKYPSPGRCTWISVHQHLAVVCTCAKLGFIEEIIHGGVWCHGDKSLDYIAVFSVSVRRMAQVCNDLCESKPIRRAKRSDPNRIGNW